LVGALLTEDATPPAPERDTDVEAIQLHIGVRYLLLSPIYGYTLKKLIVEGRNSRLATLHDGVEETYDLHEFRARVRSHVRDELDRASAGQRGAIDLTKVAEAEIAAQKDDHAKVVNLLGAWPAPLAIFLRTPEGQMLTSDARALIAKGLGLLGTACARLGEEQQGEEVLRLGVQYAQDEAIGPLRRAATLGGPPGAIWPLLAKAFVRRKRYVAGFACVREARAAGVADADMVEEIRTIEASLGTALTAWRGMVATPSARS
jgi:hypothetical protein